MVPERLVFKRRLCGSRWNTETVTWISVLLDPILERQLCRVTEKSTLDASQPDFVLPVVHVCWEMLL